MKTFSSLFSKVLAVAGILFCLFATQSKAQYLPYVVRPTGINGPNAIAFDTLGNMLVADYYNHSIKKVLPNGVTSGDTVQLYPFDYPASIVIDKYGHYFIASDSSNYIRSVYNGTLGGPLNATVSNNIIKPRGMAFDTAGILYVASLDTLGNGIVSKINTTNNSTTTFVPASAGLRSPQGLAFDAFGNLFVADDSTKTIYKVTPTGSVSAFVNGLQAQGLLFDAAGNLYVAEKSSIAIFKVTLTGGSSLFYEFANGGQNPPVALAFDKAGNMYEAGIGGNFINKLMIGGSVSQSLFATFQSLSTPKGIATPSPYNSTFNNSFVVSNFANNTISTVSNNQNVSTLVSASAGINGPIGLVYDNAYNLYVANSGSNNVLKITPDTTVSVFVPASAGLVYPSGFAMDNIGNLYVSSVGTGAITKVTPSGTVSTYVPSSAGLLEPDAIAFDGSGNLYVSNHDSTTFKGIISKVTPDGTVSVFVPASAGINANSLSFGQNVGLGTSLFATTWNNTIVEIDANSGSVIGVNADSNLNVPDAIVFSGLCSYFIANAGNNSVVSFITCDPVPVTLTSFTANLIDKSVQTNWHTATEINASHFNVQRCLDGNNFATIGTVEAKGAVHYSFTDSSLPPLMGRGLYYRLESVDKDGSSTYSKVVSVLLATYDLQLTTVSIYPNPLKDNVSVHLANNKFEKTMVQVMDMQGKIIVQQPVELQEGNNHFSIPTASLAKGNYVLIINGAESRYAKFVKE